MTVQNHSACDLVVAIPDLQLGRVPISELTSYGRRARVHDSRQIEQLANSIATFGFVVPVVVDEGGRVLAGHARLEAARKAGLTEAPTVCVSHLSPEQKRAFIIADNRLAELASWDVETLRIEFAELGELQLDFDISVTGFNEMEIDAIVFEGAAGEAEIIPEPPTQAVSEKGDLWLLGEHRLLCDDALSQSALDCLLDGEQVRTVFTDPPYNVPISGNVTKSKAHGEFVMASGEMSTEAFQDFLNSSSCQIARSLACGGLAYVCMDWRHYGQLLIAVQSADLEVVNLIVWDKTCGGMGSFYRSRHELILLVRRRGAAHLNRVKLGRHGRDRHNVWTYEGVSGFGKSKARERAMHPTVKPMIMVRDALLDSTARGDVVLDLFGGSGTTLIAAEVSRRRARVMELDPRYVDVTVGRWEALAGKPARLAGTNETFSQVRDRRDALRNEEG
jgi:DNA modification methylase